MSQFRNLVFEGGGIKGFAYLGAIEEIERRGILAEIERFAGTSMGSVFAALLACGADAGALRAAMLGTPFLKFMDDSWGAIRDANRLITDYGWYKGEEIRSFVAQETGYLLGKKNPTFRDLEKALSVIALDLTAQEEIVFSNDRTPDVQIADAVRASSGLPLFFQAMRYEDHILVDGGVSHNFPIQIFDGDIPNPATLGFRVDTSSEIGETRDGAKRSVKIESLPDYIKAFLGYLIDAANKRHLSEDDWHRTIFIDAGHVQATDFDISTDRLERLIESGRAAVRAYFYWFDNTSEPKNKIAPPQ